MKPKKDHKYLLHLYYKVDDYLTNNQNNQEGLPDIVVSFCIVVEKIIKIKLHKKNPVLLFDNSKIKENDALVAIISKKEKNIETSKIGEILGRFKLVFKNIFSDDEMQALLDIYVIRNGFVHGYKPDSNILFDEEDIIKKLGTIWEKISNQAVILFGKDSIKKNKPKKKYSEEELEKVLEEEVRTKIKPIQRGYGIQRGYRLDDDMLQVSGSVFGFTSEKCPRCGSHEFSLDDRLNSDIYSVTSVSMYPIRTFSDLYKCKKCHLELTRKEYEIAKKLNKNFYEN